MARREKLIALRIGSGGLDRVDQAAKDAGVSRSEMIRRMLAYSMWKMPKDWKP